MAKQIVIIDGHPDPDSSRFCHAIARAYADTAEGAGHSVKRFEVAQLEFPVLRTRSEWESGEAVLSVRECQQAIGSAQHIVLIYPLWLGDVPALRTSLIGNVEGSAEERAKWLDRIQAYARSGE